LRCKTCKKPHTSGSQTYTVSPFFQPKWVFYQSTQGRELSGLNTGVSSDIAPE
jgi:hypothetical protein